MDKVALITGVTGQDGSYLAELLLDKGYEVHGIKRRTSLVNTNRIDHLSGNHKFILHYGDMTDNASLLHVLQKVKPDEVYNLAAQSQVLRSFEIPEYTMQVNGVGVLRLLEAIRILGLKVKIYQASTSEMFGKTKEFPQTEKTSFYPRSPYGISKLYAYWLTVNYREAYGMFISNGILFNHESSRRGSDFVTKKITRGISDLVCGKLDKLYLGNLNSKRDWGHAKDYVRAMYMMMQLDGADDYVIATGKTFSVRDFVRKCFEYFDLDIVFEGSGIDEKGYVNDRCVVEVDPKFFRPTEVDILVGDATKAHKAFGWSPQYNLDQLIDEMLS